MADKKIEIDTNTLATDISALTEKLNTAKNCLKRIEEEMQQLDSMWDGPANEVLMTQFQKDVSYSNDVFEIVKNLIECMEYAKKEYDTCEKEVKYLVSTI